MDEAAVRHHIEFKRDTERTLDVGVAARMISALDRGDPADYAALYRRAREWMPAIVYHTAPSPQRSSIIRDGLRMSVPGPPNWLHDTAIGQPCGVYVGPRPDERGMWAHWPAWDVWVVDAVGLKCEPDDLQRDSWVILEHIAPQRLSFHGTYGTNTWTESTG